jgi:hypothetical protein
MAGENRPRWENPEEDASFAAAFLEGAADARPVPPLTDAEKVRLRDLMIRGAENGDADGVARLQALADNPLGLRELFARFPEPAGA